MIEKEVIFKKNKYYYLFLILLGLISSVMSSSLLIIINNTINGTTIASIPIRNDVLFVLVLAGSFLSRMFFQTLVTRHTFDTLYGLETLLYKNLKDISFQSFEKLGRERIYAAASDINILGSMVSYFLNALNDIVVVLFSLVYLFAKSFMGGVVIVSVMAVLLIFYSIRNKINERKINEVRDMQNRFYRYLNDLLLGFQEIKMSSKRVENIYKNYLLHNLGKKKELGAETATRVITNNLMGSFSWYVLFGVVTFALPNVFEFDYAQKGIFIITILYLMGPFIALTGIVPLYTNVKIASQRLNGLVEEIGGAKAKEAVALKHPGIATEEFESIQFEEVVYEYVDANTKTGYKVGPLNLTIREGEVLFITGGNGSGKSTFIKLLAGLYEPKEGRVFYNRREIAGKDYLHYRDKISAIFTSSYLFVENYNEFDLRKENLKLRRYVDFMMLTDDIIFKGDLINYNLSKGQQKRLSLIFAMMENKEVLVLDEWAAEQDPEFRRYFYRTVLPELKKAGKTVIAVTHDDNYFNCADRIMKFEFGKVKEIITAGEMQGITAVAAAEK